MNTDIQINKKTYKRNLKFWRTLMLNIYVIVKINIITSCIFTEKAKIHK